MGPKPKTNLVHPKPKPQNGNTAPMSRNNRCDSPRAAREAAAEAQGFLASIEISAGNEVFEVPQRGLLDDDQAERLAELDLETEGWDREPDVTLENGLTVPGRLKMPYRKGGKLIKPSYPVRVAVALWGEERYARYKAAGGRATDVTSAMLRLDRRVAERESEDSKSVASDPKAAELAD